MAKNRKLTQEQAEKKVKDYNDEYELISEYGDNNKCSVILRHKCGHEYKVGRYQSFFEGKNKCPICYPKRNNPNPRTKMTLQTFLWRLFVEAPDHMYISGFDGTKKPCKFKHLKCGNIIEMTPDSMFNKHTKCKYCANENRGSHLREENYLENILARQIDGDEYTWLDEYHNNNKEQLRIRHKCGYEYTTTSFAIDHGEGRCLRCTEGSVLCEKFKRLLDELNLSYTLEKKFDGLVYKDPLRVDFYIESLDISFEIDGKQHFVDNDFFKDPLSIRHDRDITKNEWFKNNHKSLIRIPYDIKDEDLQKLVSNLANRRIAKDIVGKYSIYFYNAKYNHVFNESAYYDRLIDNPL